MKAKDAVHCWLEVGELAIMGADMAKDWAPNIDTPKNGFDVTLHFDDADKAKAVFDALSVKSSRLSPRRSVSERFRRLVELLGELDDFDAQVTLNEAVMPLGDGAEHVVTQVYLGLSHGLVCHGRPAPRSAPSSR